MSGGVGVTFVVTLIFHVVWQIRRRMKKMRDLTNQQSPTGPDNMEMTPVTPGIPGGRSSTRIIEV